MITGITFFSITFFRVFLRAFQQLNVVHNKYLVIVPISFLMALCEFVMIGLIAANYTAWIYILPMALGGGLGCILSMWLHKKLLRKEEKDEADY